MWYGAQRPEPGFPEPRLSFWFCYKSGVRLCGSQYLIWKHGLQIFFIKNPWWRPWLGWLSGLGVILQTKGSPVQFPVRTHSWVAGQVPGWGHVCERLIDVSLTSIFLSCSFSLPSLLAQNKINKRKLKIKNLWGCKANKESTISTILYFKDGHLR